ncbi:Aspartic peptidase domain containing protein [Tylopilus felleus]
MKTFTAFSFILLSTSTYVNASPTASPVGNFTVTVPLIRLNGTGAYLNGAADASRARARFLKSRTSTGPFTVSMLSTVPHLVVEVGVGKPPLRSYYKRLVVDTGSSTTWIHTGHDFCGISSMGYRRPPTRESTGQKVSSKYASDTISFEGDEYLDDVTLAPGLVVTKQSIGSVSRAIGVDHLDIHGILGLGPVDLTKGTLHPKTNALVPTVMNNLKSQERITKEVFSVYIPPMTSSDKTKGRLTYGGIDKNLYDGELTYVPLTKISPASQYWGIDLSSCTYGSHTIIETLIAGIVDTGSPVIRIPNDVFDVYRKAIPEAEFDRVISPTEIPPSSVEHMQPLHFRFGDHDFTLDVDAQLLPQRMNRFWGGNAGKRYSFVCPIGHITGHGLDFILGIPFMEKYYTVHDADEQRIGFARASRN